VLTGRRRKLTALLGFLVVLSVGAWVFRDIWLTQIGQWLVVETPLAKSDAILVLALNESRLHHGWTLFDRGWSDTVLVSVGQHLLQNCFGSDVDIPQWTKNRVVSHGVPEDRVRFLWRATSTFDEAELARNTAIARGWSSLMVVSDRTHMRRASFIFQRVFESTGVEPRFSAVPKSASWSDLDRWWTREGSAFTMVK